MEKTLNEISLLWNDIGLFNDISRIPSTSSADRLASNEDFTEELNYNEHIITNKIENLSHKWNILMDQIKNNETIIKLHENTIFNFSELTIKEILLHNNFKYINQNYNQLLQLKEQLNAKIHRMESIYNNYNNLNLNERFINSLPISSRDFDCKITDLIDVIRKIKSSIEFFEHNKSYYKSDFYKTKYQEQFKLLLQYVKMLLKNYFNGLAHFNTPGSPGATLQVNKDGSTNDISTNKLIRSLERIRGLLTHIRNEEDEMLQIEMYYINFRLQLLDNMGELPNDKSNFHELLDDIEVLVNHFINLINLEMLYYNVLFGDILSTDQASVLINSINNNFNTLLKVYFNNLGKSKNFKNFGEMETTNEKLRSTMVELNNYRDHLFNKNVNTASLNSYFNQAENMLVNNLMYFFNNFGSVTGYPFDYSYSDLSTYSSVYLLKHASTDVFSSSKDDLSKDAGIDCKNQLEKNELNACIHPLVYQMLIVINKYDGHILSKVKLYKSLMNNLKKMLNDFGYFKTLKLSKQLHEVNIRLFMYNNLYYFKSHLNLNTEDVISSGNAFSELKTHISQIKIKLVQMLIEQLCSKGVEKMDYEGESKLNKIYNVLYNLNNDQSFVDSIVDLILSHFKLDRHLLSRNTEEADNILVI
ncbi:hypothetical protein MACJ_002278 [Theileria orientalis]|uniref:Uncharacterized protein n=1 Tax=Theileria orientalis TaxID=68886 RepID=A0A976M5X7_THEOR|nr:hypothetical protein MACJ_002278 [Theileria orientalis]